MLSIGNWVTVADTQLHLFALCGNVRITNRATTREEQP
jgi:hypothetical protein